MASTAVRTVELSKSSPVRDVTISKSGGDIVQWRSIDKNDYLVVFEQGSPFQTWWFPVSGEGNPKDSGTVSEAVLVAPEEWEEFKYSVHSNGWKSDPKVKVKP